MKLPEKFISSSTIFILTICLVLFFFMACEKEKMPSREPVYVFETDSITDVEGNVYRTVKIGNQWWMAENLRTSHYRNNVSIFNGQNLADNEWATIKKGAFCTLYNSSVPFNGLLYNCFAIMDTNVIAPQGWHVPTDEDWKQLEQFIGLSPDSVNILGWRGTHCGEKLKSVKTTELGWDIDIGIHNTNEFGFSALPGGCRLENGSFNDAGQYSSGFWWTSSNNGNGEAWYRYLDYHYSGIFRHYAPKASCYSIRCIKNE
jgi:uncharacterized protein (TIGR02145 family)